MKKISKWFQEKMHQVLSPHEGTAGSDPVLSLGCVCVATLLTDGQQPEPLFESVQSCFGCL